MAQQTEVECKYRISAHELGALQKTLRAQCVQCQNVEKHDTYYTLAINGVEKLLRLRRTGEACVLTYKEKKCKKGVEENHEYEVGVEDEETMHAMLRALGATLYATKYKRGQAFSLPRTLYGHDVSLELVEVPPLGYFAEIECLAEPREQKLQGLYHTLTRVAHAYQLSDHAQEPRLYIDMLKEHS